MKRFIFAGFLFLFPALCFGWGDVSYPMLKSTDAGRGAAFVGLTGYPGKSVANILPMLGATTAGNGSDLIGYTGNPGETLSDVLFTLTSGDPIPAAGYVKRVEDIATLRTYEGVADGQPVQVMGYYTAGDGGGGPVRRWDAASVCVDNGGACIDPDAVGAGRWVWNHSGEINVKWYGNLVSAIAGVSGGSTIYIPAGYTETLSTAIPISKNLTIYSNNRDGVTITGPANLPVFTGTGTVTQFVLKGITWLGGAGTSRLLDVQTGAAWSEGKIIIENNHLRNFGDYALYFGNSIYTRNINNNRFDNCNGAMFEGFASDSILTDNFFNDNDGANPVLYIKGGARTVLIGNEFIKGTGTITAPDILIDPFADYGGGKIYAAFNKFGAEGDIPNRPKVRIYNATVTNRAGDITFTHNQFHGAYASAGGDTVAFVIDNPVINIEISNNEFDETETIIDDNAIYATGETGSAIYKDNRVYLATRFNYKVFAHGGRGFSAVDSPQSGQQWGLNNIGENLETRNRLSYSSALINWNKSTGVTITGAQADPYGGTNAALFSRDGSIPSQQFSRVIDKVTGGALVTDKLHSKFWLKAGTAETVLIGLRDNTNSRWAGQLQYISAGNEWRQYSMQFAGIDTSHDYSLYFYINGTDNGLAGDVYLFAPQVSEYESDYLPTPANVGAKETVTKRFNGKVKFSGGITAALSVYADNAAALVGGLVAGDFYRTATGEMKVVY